MNKLRMNKNAVKAFFTRAYWRKRLASTSPAFQRRAFVTAMSLPAVVQRRITGAPARADGAELAADAAMMLWLIGLIQGKVKGGRLNVPASRVGFEYQSGLAGGAHAIGEVRDLVVDGATGPLDARLYVPTSSVAGAPDPLMVFFHGGGFCLGSLDSHDGMCRFLAENAGVRVLAVDYRLVPEQKFPAQHDDAVAAFRWTRANADLLGADPANIGVGGDSAGGNLAAHVALSERTGVAWQVLMYPVTSDSHRTASMQRFAEGFFLSTWFIQQVGPLMFADEVEAMDPRYAVLYAAPHSDVAPAYVATAGFDPLRDEGELYADLLRASGIEVRHRRFEDQLHGFASILSAGRSMRAATAEVARQITRLSRDASVRARG